MRRKGFSLIELITVVAVLVVLIGATVPYLGRYFARRQLETAGYALVQDLRRVQMSAISSRTNRKVQFVPGSNWYRFETEAGSLVLPPKLDGLCKRQLGGSVGFPRAFGKYAPSSGYFGGASTNACPPSGVVVLTFNAFGRPCEGGGRVTLMDRAGDRVDVIVTPVVGRIRMEWVH
jgi:prepilin-type N-terminal cleavage/methylation domain-containing protein